jgi:hypothetical protein
MATEPAAVRPNVEQAVPFFMVTNIEASLRFYLDGLGFTMTNSWRPDYAKGRVQWCWLKVGDAALVHSVKAFLSASCVLMRSRSTTI